MTGLRAAMPQVPPGAGAPSLPVLAEHRFALLALLPAGGRMVEVGVAQGRFAEAIWRTCRPARLDLVDDWRHRPDRPGPPLDPNNPDQPAQDARFLLLAGQWSARIHVRAAGLHRVASPLAAAAFADASLDAVFLDADHGEDAVLADLRAWTPKLKPVGWLVGHDYCDHDRARSLGIGTVAAVARFTADSPWRLAGITGEDPAVGFPSFVLRRETADG